MNNHNVNLSMKKRILVTGCPGSGKTYFSAKLAAVTQLPLYHMDDLYWGRNWTRVPHDQWTAAQRELVRQDRWIIDGNHHTTLDIRIERADLIIYLNINVLKALYRITRRGIKRLFDSSTLPINLRNDPSHRKFALRIDWKFVKKVFAFNRSIKPYMFDKFRDYGLQKNLIILANTREIYNFFNQANEQPPLTIKGA